MVSATCCSFIPWWYFREKTSLCLRDSFSTAAWITALRWLAGREAGWYTLDDWIEDRLR